MFEPQTVSWAEWISSAATEMNAAIWESLAGMGTHLFERLPYLAAGLIVALIFWAFSRLSRRIFMAGMRKTSLDNRLRILFARLIAGSVLALGFLTALTVIVPSFSVGSLIAGLGFTTFVVGFAIKDIINNFLSGVLILWGRPFNLGDYLFIGSHQGVVEYIGVRATSLRKDDGEVVIIPNGDMYSQAITIRGAGSRRRISVKLAVGFDAEISRVKEIGVRALRDVQGIIAKPEPSAAISALDAHGFEVTVVFWTDTKKRSPLLVFDDAAAAVAKALLAEKIKIFPEKAS